MTTKSQEIKKQTRVLSKKILRHLFIVGTISLAATSPHFVRYFMKEIFDDHSRNRRRYYNSFYYLKKRGFIEVERDGRDIHVSLTKEGEWWTGNFEFNELEISKPKKWDGKWRIIIFDIPHEHRMKRDVLRKKLKELGFYSLQKSVWVYPYECKKEIKIIRDFLGLSKYDLRIIRGTVEDDSHLREGYDL